jgi:predicted phage terminase large subunit-like protein
VAGINLQKKLGSKEFQRKADEILNALRTEVRPFEDASETARKARVERSLADKFYFFNTYLPHYFSLPEAKFHHELIEELDVRNLDDDASLVPFACAAPRGFAKSTVTSFGYVIHQLCHGRRHFIIIGSDTEDLASDITCYIYLELLFNERIRADFGEQVLPGWAVNDFVTLKDVRLLARGRGQRMRGLKHKQWRPDLVILDDMENDENVKNPKQVKKLLSWIKAAVYSAIQPTGNLFLIGTLLAPKSALAIIVHQKEEPFDHWRVKRYQGLQADGTSLWPSSWPVARLLKHKEMIGAKAFAQEIQNAPFDDEGMFQEAWVRYVENEDELKGNALRVLTGADPSATSGASSDYKAVITGGYDVETGTLYCLSAYIRHESPKEFVSRIYDVHKAHHPLLIGVEENMLKEWLWEPVALEAKKRGYWPPFKAVHHLQNKEGRLMKVSAMMEHGKIVFIRNQTDQGTLVEQLLAFPNGTVNDDGPDALEIVVSLIEQVAGAAPEYRTVEKRRFAGQVGAY